MSLHPRAGKPAQVQDLINVARLVSDYYALKPDMQDPHQRVAFGTSGHRGCASQQTFNDAHIAAVCQALVEYRQQQGIQGPLFIGFDTHALSEAAFKTALEVFCANQVQVIIEKDRGYTPTPVISFSILRHNKTHDSLADGVVITPSHNPPQDGGFKYNPPHGGPAGSDVTDVIQARANQLLSNNNQGVKRLSFVQALASASQQDLAAAYIDSLAEVIDMQAIAKANLRLAADPLGGAGGAMWSRIAEQYQLNIEVVNTETDATFRFMTLDKDGQIRMDCSSPYAMAGLISLKDQFDLSFGNDADFDRHGIVDATHGLLNPNHFLAVAIDYLFQHRPDWHASMKVGKTLVSSSLIDRVTDGLGRELAEMPVGFKWFVNGLQQAEIGFAGEESAGGIFLKRDGQVWATDKDGFIMCLLAAEILAVTNMSPYQYYQQLTQKYGQPVYQRVDVAATPEQKKRLAEVDAASVAATTLAGEPILSIQSKASGNQAAIGGVKVSTENGWFAARPSGTENVYKIYAESFLGETHLAELLKAAQTLVDSVINPVSGG